MPAIRLAILIVLTALVLACSGGAPAVPPTAAPPPPTAAPPPPTAAPPVPTSAPAGQPAAKPAEKPFAQPASASPVAAAATPTSGSAAKPVAAGATPERKFEIQQPKPIQTLRPFVYPTIPPFQVPGEIQQPGQFQQLPAYTWPTIGEFQRPGEIQVPGEIQKPGEIQAVSTVPTTAECMKTATLQPVGTFTGESFKVQLAPATGDCVIPAGMIFKSAEGLQDMLVMSTVKVSMTGGPATVNAYANCMDFSKHGPEPNSKYSVGGMVGATSTLGKLIAALPSVPQEKITAAGLQAAVWAITNDVSKNSVSRVLKYEQPDADSARTILQAAGVDPASKALFK